MSLDELKTQNIRTVTEKALVCFIKNGITITKVSEKDIIVFVCGREETTRS